MSKQDRTRQDKRGGNRYNLSGGYEIDQGYDFETDDIQHTVRKVKDSLKQEKQINCHSHCNNYGNKYKNDTRNFNTNNFRDVPKLQKQYYSDHLIFRDRGNPGHNWKPVTREDCNTFSKSNKYYCQNHFQTGFKKFEYFTDSNFSVNCCHKNSGDQRVNRDVCYLCRDKKPPKYDKETGRHYLHGDQNFTSYDKDKQTCCRECYDNRVCEEKLVNSIVERLKCDFNITPKEKPSEVCPLHGKITNDTKGVYVFIPTLDDNPKYFKKMHSLYKNEIFDNEQEILMDTQERKTELRKLLNKYSLPKSNCVGERFTHGLKNKLDKIVSSLARLLPNESNHLFLKKFENHLKNVLDKHKYEDQRKVSSKYKRSAKPTYEQCKDHADDNEMFEYFAEKIASMLI